MVFGFLKKKSNKAAVPSDLNAHGQSPAAAEEIPGYSSSIDRDTPNQDTKTSNLISENSLPANPGDPSIFASTSTSHDNTTVETAEPSNASSLPPSYAAHARVTSQPRLPHPSESDYRAGYLWSKTPNLPTDPKPEPHRYSTEEVAEMERKGISPQLKWELDAYKREGRGTKRAGFWRRVGMMDRVR